jgi:hypothetical protein
MGLEIEPPITLSHLTLLGLRLTLALDGTPAPTPSESGHQPHEFAELMLLATTFSNRKIAR